VSETNADRAVLIVTLLLLFFLGIAIVVDKDSNRRFEIDRLRIAAGQYEVTQ
jgi:hypothetical protein